MRDSLTIIGTGRMGLTLAAGLAESGVFGDVRVSGRHREAPDHPMFADERVLYQYGVDHPPAGTVAVLIAVPDNAVPEVAAALAAQGPAPEGCVVCHLAGALPTDVLEPLHHAGYGVGVFHPILAVADPGIDPRALVDAFVAVTGGPDTVARARRIADALGAHVFTVAAGRRSTYHAAVVMASSLVLPLLATSVTLMQRAGVDGDDALAAILPLVRSMLDAVERGGLPEAIRGPIVRGDVETVDLHLRALEPDEARLYAVLGMEALRLSAGSLDPEVSEQLSDLFGRHLHFETTETGY